MKKPMIRLRWLGVGVLCTMLSIAQATIQEDLDAELDLEQVVQNALEEGTPAEEITLQLIEVGYDPVDVAELVAAAAPSKAASVCSVAAQEAEIEMAAVIAAACTRSAPDAAVEIAAAVTEVAPENADAIAAAVANVVPDAADDIAAAVTQVAPESADAIAASVTDAVPIEAAEVAAAVTQVAPDAAEDVAESVTEVAPDAAEEIYAEIDEDVGLPTTPTNIVVTIQQDMPTAPNAGGSTTPGGLIPSGEAISGDEDTYIWTNPITNNIPTTSTGEHITVIESEDDEDTVIIVVNGEATGQTIPVAARLASPN